MDPNCNPIEQQKIQDRLEAWYVEDGRDNPEHPLHSFYTGLAEKFGQEGQP
jgi:hypothetical protein